MNTFSMRSLISEGNPFTAMARQTQGTAPQPTPDTEDADPQEIFDQGYEAGYNDGVDEAGQSTDVKEPKKNQIARGLKRGISIGTAPLRGLSKVKDAILGPGKYSTQALDKLKYRDNDRYNRYNRYRKYSDRANNVYGNK